jgi:transposase InsO family protein
VIRCDNGQEYISETIKTWAAKHGIEIAFIQPGQAQQNAYVERYNRTVRYDWLAHHFPGRDPGLCHTLVMDIQSRPAIHATWRHHAD